jgi:hypothetical protein
MVGNSHTPKGKEKNNNPIMIARIDQECHQGLPQAFGGIGSSPALLVPRMKYWLDVS